MADNSDSVKCGWRLTLAGEADLSCEQPAGHDGLHRDPRGAWWAGTVTHKGDVVGPWPERTATGDRP